MKIFITGTSGFIGNYLNRYLKKYFEIVSFDLRKINNLKTLNETKLLKEINSGDIIINCAASLRPKNKTDFFINSDFPYFLSKYLNDKNLHTKIIHISTVNTNVEFLKDNYSLSKKRGEELLKTENVIILKLPLIIQENNNKELIQSGQLSIFFKYLDLKFLPIYPMIYPGNYFNPIDIGKLSKFILSLINSEENKGIYNLSGLNKFSTWQLFEKIAKKKNKKIIKVKTKLFTKFLPKILTKLVYKYNFLYNLIGNIDFEKHSENNKLI